MQNNEATVKIRGRSIPMSVDGMTELEITSIAVQVEKKMAAIEELTNIVDTSKLAVMAAMEFAIELHNLKQRAEVTTEADTRKIAELVTKLESAMEKELF